MITRSINILADVMVEQFSEIINSSPILTFKISLWLYQSQNKEFDLHRSQSAPAPSSEQIQQASESELVLLEVLLSIQADQRQCHFQLKDLLLPV